LPWGGLCTSSGHQTWKRTRFFDSIKSLHYPLSSQRLSVTESRYNNVFLDSSTLKSRQVAVSYGPHLLDLDGLVDLDDLASYKAVLLAEAA
jgi:hypothetical protein